MGNRFLISIYVVLFLMLLLPLKILPAGGNIEGFVKDAQTKQGLPGANVILKNTGKGSATDQNGKYVIRDVPAGVYIIRASYIGYASQEYTIEVKEGLTTEYNFELVAVGIEGKTVVVTAQASGQNAAINQQLSSSQIKNVVSAARIQELPDANAAESVGRLPGISLIRSGGEGSKVVIRGLAPQYNQIMINGVKMAPTDAGDRGVDLSMISSTMLGGIEVTKAITPDMDANVLGGVVNFQLREAKENRNPGVDFIVQGGYNDLQKTYDDFKIPVSIENRFLNNKLGLFAQINVERRNLTSNVLGASYVLNAPKLGQTNPVYLTSLNLTDIPRIRYRYGITVVIDYALPDFKIDLMNFVSSGKTNEQIRGESYSLDGNTHSYTTTDQNNKLNVMTNLLSIEKNFSLFTVNAKVAHSYSENSTPDAITFGFSQTSVGLNNPAYQRLNPEAIPPLAKNDLKQTYLLSVGESYNFSREREISASLDLQSYFSFSEVIAGMLKFGGSYRYTDRAYNYESSNGPLYQGGGGVIRKAILDSFPWMKDSLSDPNSLLPITIFRDPNFSYGNFLGGDFQMGVPINIDLMHKVMDIVRQYNVQQSFSYDKFSSTTNDYSGNEYESAAYIMSKINFGQNITFIPGVRYQQLITTYTAPRGFQQGIDRLVYNYRDTTIRQLHGFWLPMIHLIYKPLSWLQLRAAYTKTLTYPAYSAIVPRINIGFGDVAWNNFALKPAESTNYDLVLSIYSNSIGLFTINGFLKEISDLIFPVNRYVINPSDYPGIDSTTIGYTISTSINNPYKAKVYGFELDWQTHFWYLPGIFSGLVLQVNYTHMFSKAQYPRTTLTIVYFPKFQRIENNTFYSDRLIFQPNNILNLAVGYDYEGFSARVSMLLQSDVFQGESFWPELRINTARYLRWDLSIKQNLPWYDIQIFFDVNNINSARDVNINQGSNFPQAEQHYGLTADLGLRLRL